jgi:hypothetical protein
MKRFTSLRVVASLLVLFTMGVLSPQTANAQAEQVCNPPVDFHRFIVNWSTFGTFLTDDFNEGLNRGFAPYAFPGPMKIAIPPGPGYTPVPGQGLQPLYRFRIVQGSRTYFGYFNGFASGPGYFFEKVAGYTLPGFGQFGGVPLHAWYSQSKGYFYTQGFFETPFNQPPSTYGFTDHFYPAYMPDGATYCWNPPPPPCSDPEAEQACINNGGEWNPVNCTCRPPNPCEFPAAPGPEEKGKDGDPVVKLIPPCL